MESVCFFWKKNASTANKLSIYMTAEFRWLNSHKIAKYCLTPSSKQVPNCDSCLSFGQNHDVHKQYSKIITFTKSENSIFLFVLTYFIIFDF